jgi:hypothetical protein
MLDFTIVRDQNAKKTNMELLATTKEAIGKCLNAHLCRHMKYARMGRINKNEQCSVYELTNLYNALSSPLSFADGVGMQGVWDLVSYSEDGIVTTDIPDGWVTLVIGETQMLPNLGSDGLWANYTQVDFNTITQDNLVDGYTITIVYNADGSLTATWTNPNTGYAYILIFERVIEEAKDCCVTREDIIAAYCHVINYCGCTPVAHGEFPDLPDLPQECTCADGITFWMPYDWDVVPTIYLGLFFAYSSTVRNHCVFTALINGAIITLSYNETLLQWEITHPELGLLAASPDLIGSAWTVNNWGGEAPTDLGISECGSTVANLCVSVITVDGSVQHTFYPTRYADTLLIAGYGAFSGGTLVPTVAGPDYWLLTVLDINGDYCLAANDKIYMTLDAAPLGTHVDACHRSIIIATGVCTELTACQLLYVQSAQKLGVEDGLHEIELAVTGGTAPYTYEWFSDVLMTVPVGTGTDTLSNLSCGNQRWFRVTDSLGCTFEDSRTIICT